MKAAPSSKKPAGGGRKPVARDLPPLSSAASEFCGWKDADNRTKEMFEILRAVVARCQRAKTRPFYTVREVADYFGVAVGTAATVYKQLAQEGLLMRVRGSKTMIPPKRSHLRHEIRGLVSLPIWLPGFLMHTDWRRWLVAMDDELAKHRYAAEPVFFNQEYGAIELLQHRILARNPDWVLWGFPAPALSETLLRIADRGTQIMCLENLFTGFPGVTYRIEWQQALDAGLREWKADQSLNGIIIPRSTVATSIIPRLDSVLSAVGCEAETLKLGPSGKDLFSFLERLLARERCGLIFNDDILYARACSEQPQIMLKLFTRHRVMVMREVLLPCEQLPDGVTGDALRIPVRQLARSMASDLASGKAFAGQPARLVHPEWRPRRPLAELVQCEWDS